MWGKLFGSIGGTISSLTHSLVAKGREAIEGFHILEALDIAPSYEDYGIAIDQWQDLDTWRNRLESIESDRLIPGSWMKQRESVLQSRFEYTIKSSYVNPEGEEEEVFMTIASDQRLTQDEILGSDMIPECAEMLALGIEDLPFDIVEGYLSA